ncbi:Amidophosphoribosyltransferase [Papilio xuthus]|uniref:Amidophosphoribosyltransferase n=1 Tax=Papilio xuthus TaxID=66420 RepID=A0A0N1PFZ9_PAPXU|nr:Amidophosphoribosyltransferase [Papilio xuthus]
MLKDKIYAVRDPYGNRPLCLGKILPLGSSLAQSEDSPVAMKLKKICLKTPIGEEQAAQAVLDPALGHFQGEATRRVVVACCGVRTPVLLVGRSVRFRTRPPPKRRR